MVDLDAYFARIGYDGPRAPTIDVLRALHALHPAAIPFEAIDVLLGRGVDLSPQAVDAKLIGARRDSIRGREAVAVVYRLRGHFISVYSWRRSDGAHSELDTTVRGFNVVQWSDRDLDYAAVSDVDGVELKRLVAAIRS